MAKRRRGRGEGGVEQLPSGSWRAVVCRIVDGKRVRASKTFPDKKDAIAWMAAQQAAGTQPVAAGTVGEWLTRWLAGHKLRVAQSSHLADTDTVNRYLMPAFGKDKLRDLEPDHIERKIAALTCSDNEKHKAARTLKNALNAAVRAKLLVTSPMSDGKVRLPRRRVKESIALTPDDLGKLLTHADTTPHGPVFRLWVDAGLRPGELLGLRWGDIDLDAGTVRVRRAVCGRTGKIKEPKTRKSKRTLPLAESTVAALRTLTREGDDVPLTHPAPRDGRPKHWWLTNFSRHIFRPLVKAAGVQAVPYTMRHTCATLLLRAGVGLKVVSERLGHEDVVMTLRSYAHCLPDEQHRAAKAMGGILPTVIPTAGENR